MQWKNVCDPFTVGLLHNELHDWLRCAVGTLCLRVYYLVKASKYNQRS